MSILSVPLTPKLEKGIIWLVEMGVASNKADAARKALEFFIQEQAIQDVLDAEKEIAEGKILRGDLRDLMKKL